MTAQVYHVEYELCALLFLFLVTRRFFSMRRFPSRSNNLFGTILICALADVALDIIGSCIVMHSGVFPDWINYMVNTVFYGLQIAFPALMLTYIVYTSGRTYRTNRSLLLWLAPACILFCLLLTNVFTHFFFYLVPTEDATLFQHGPLFITLYLGTLFYVFGTLVLTLHFRADLDRKIRSTIYRFISIIIIAIVVQFFFPEYLLTGVALALAIQMMFFTIQNPDDMLDLISGAFNYNAMMKYMDGVISRKSPLRFIIVDVDGIRRVNSAYGLSAGNEVFSCVGSFFNSLNANLWTFRMIGSRFLLASTREAGFQQAIFHICKRFEQSWKIDENELMLTAKVRYYDAPEHFSSPEEIIDLVDMVFSDAVACSWGQSMRIGNDLLILCRRWAQVEEAVREALKTRSGLSLHFQPIYNVRSKRFSSAEALLRLESPTLGTISPSEFIPVAERSGLILQIDEFVLRKSCTFLAEHPEPELLELNLSAAEFHRNPCSRILSIVEECHADPGRICFEVTETAAIGHPENLSEFMHEMIRRGFRFALDDFGTGYANITQVTGLPFAIAKMDKMLLAEDAKTRVVFDSLIGMFSNIGISTVVEGVETPDHSARVSSRADYIQGFYYSKPMSEDEYCSFLAHHQEEEDLPC